MWQEQELRGIHPDIEPAGAGLVVGALTGISEEMGGDGMAVAVMRGMAVGEVAVETEEESMDLVLKGYLHHLAQRSISRTCKNFMKTNDKLTAHSLVDLHAFRFWLLLPSLQGPFLSQLGFCDTLPNCLTRFHV